jgi:hypothetical protein
MLEVLRVSPDAVPALHVAALHIVIARAHTVIVCCMLQLLSEEPSGL